ncbi:MAG TPA: MnhB domain-containing protein [Candidatus Limnocylindria bacterium]|nr:MnhB domain-containing protein [Candidatus Limnocylindria bacterium]
MIERHDSIIVVTFVRVLVPLVQLFALYVLVYGHYGPGGGFQAGVLLAATYMLIALALGREAFERRVNERACVALAAAGVLLFVATGVAGMLGGAAFLDYSVLPLPVSPVKARYFGILFIEVGVAIAVAATLVLLFARLADTEHPL